MRAFLITALFFIVFTASGQTRFGIGFWNVENLYDTIPSLFYDDTDYTPEGRYGWNSTKYGAKIENLARVIDLMALDVIGLAEVESETAVRDLVTALDTDYNYIHRHTRDGRGMDVVLLYKGDKFVPTAVRQIDSGTSREFLYVRGELSGRRIDLVVCHLPSRMNSKSYRRRAVDRLGGFVDSLVRADSGAVPVVMGDMNMAPKDPQMKLLTRAGLKNPFSGESRKGHGSYMYRNKWLMYDNILVGPRIAFGSDGNSDDASGGFHLFDHGIFIRSWMLSDSGRRAGYPLRTFSGGIDTNGFSDHLPVYMVLGINPPER